jgi:hypothetical protein
MVLHPQLQRCASCCSAWRGASDTHVTTAPPGETSTPTHGAAVTQAPDARHSCCSAGSGDRRVLNDKNRSSLHRGKTKKPDRAQTSVRPTAVLPGQECARGRHTRTPSGTPPAGPKRRREGRRSTPVKESKQLLYCGRRPEGTSRLSLSTRGPQLIRLTTGSGACGREASRRAAKTRPVQLKRYNFLRDSTLLMPLDRDTERSPRTRVLAVISRW